MNKKFIKMSIGIVLVSIVFALTGCQSFLFTPPEQTIQERVEAMMTARVNDDWAEVYQYLDPGYRKGKSKTSFAGMKRNLSFRDFTIESIDIAESGKEAQVKVKYTIFFPAFGVEVPDRIDSQTWIKVGCRWYFQMKISDNPMDP